MTKLSIQLGSRILLVILAISLLMGISGAFFLYALQFSYDFIQNHIYVIYLLPLAGMFTAWIYQKYGKHVSEGVNLIILEIKKPESKLNSIMSPLILLSTIISHLFGASVGREGTAVQMGASIADQFSSLFKSDQIRVYLIKCGVAAGFAAVFGTPFAGIVFAFEWAYDKKINVLSLVLVSLCAFCSYYCCQLFNPPHTYYSAKLIPVLTDLKILLIIPIAIIFGLCSLLFCFLTQQFKTQLTKIKNPLWRPFVGGTLFIIGISVLQIIQYPDWNEFLGLGLNQIQNAFIFQLPAIDWIIKLLFTSIVIGSAFKGGEVTPLFFIGACLGNILAQLFGFPLDFLAGMGFVAVFAGAANTPWACVAMAFEIFGWKYGIWSIPFCFMAFWSSGFFSIYKHQDLKTNKYFLFNRLKP